MRPLSIAYVVTGLETGGAEMMLLKLLAASDREHWRPSVVSLRDRGMVGDVIERLGIPVVTLSVRGSLPGPRAAWRLRRAVVMRAPALIQGWMYHGNLAALAGRALGPGRPPVVWSIRNTVYDFSSDGWITAGVVRLGALLSSYVASIIYNSRTGARQHAELGYATTKAVVIPNGFDSGSFTPSQTARAAFRHRLGVGEEVVLIGRVGRYHAMKDYPGFLKAAAILTHERPGVQFVLAGQGVNRANVELDRLLAGLGLGHAVHLLGEVRPANELMAALDIACSSSAYGEGFPSVLGEAMACGVPCVATDVGDSAWVVGDAGEIVPPGDPLALAGAFRALVDVGAEARRELGAQGRARVLREFSLQRVASQYEAVHLQVLESGAQG